MFGMFHYIVKCSNLARHQGWQCMKRTAASSICLADQSAHVAVLGSSEPGKMRKLGLSPMGFHSFNFAYSSALGS